METIRMTVKEQILRKHLTKFRTSNDRKLASDIIWLDRFRHFHHLQNALYLFTGSELELNLNKDKV